MRLFKNINIISYIGWKLIESNLLDLLLLVFINAPVACDTKSFIDLLKVEYWINYFRDQVFLCFFAFPFNYYYEFRNLFFISFASRWLASCSLAREILLRPYTFWEDKKEITPPPSLMSRVVFYLVVFLFFQKTGACYGGLEAAAMESRIGLDYIVDNREYVAKLAGGELFFSNMPAESLLSAIFLVLRI